MLSWALTCSPGFQYAMFKKKVGTHVSSEYCSYPVCIFRCNFSFSELCIFWVAKSQWNLLLIYLSWDDLWLALFQNYVWHLHPSSQMAAITKWYKKRIIWCLRYMCSNFFFKHGILKTRWACQGIPVNISGVILISNMNSDSS
jgi:hypothetical protein